MVEFIKTSQVSKSYVITDFKLPLLKRFCTRFIKEKIPSVVGDIADWVIAIIFIVSLNESQFMLSGNYCNILIAYFIITAFS